MKAQNNSKCIFRIVSWGDGASARTASSTQKEECNYCICWSSLSGDFIMAWIIVRMKVRDQDYMEDTMIGLLLVCLPFCERQITDLYPYQVDYHFLSLFLHHFIRSGFLLIYLWYAYLPPAGRNALHLNASKNNQNTTSNNFIKPKAVRPYIEH